MTKSDNWDRVFPILIILMFSIIIFNIFFMQKYDYHSERSFCDDAGMDFLDYDTCVKYQDGYEMRKDFGKDQNGNLAFKEMTE